VDYHNNINLQMNYWPACSTNLTECELPLIDFIRTLVDPGQRTASAYFGARGWTAAISGNIFGFTAPVTDHDMSWNFNPMAGPWLATHIWEYYDYTRDKDWLRRVGYDILKQSALFAQDYLYRRPDGTLTASPSTSPEHGPVDEGTTFVHGVIREVLLCAIDASRALGVDSKLRTQWQQVLDKLAPYRIGRYGQLMEWSKDIDDPADEHRHVNHLFGLHPGHTISPITTPELAQASRVVLEHRGDGATGWSMGWKLNQWARLQDGDHAYLLLGNLLKNGTTDNLWDIHPPFQIDGNFGGTAGMTELLLQSHAGFIQLLPALPSAWSKGRVSGLRARGGFEVALTWDEGKLSEATVVSLAGETCTLRYGDATLSFRTKKGASYRIVLRDGELVRE
jgi:alpha-L-fucosidase 2